VWHNVLADPLAQAQIVDATHRRAANNIVCVGHLYTNKGQDVLLRALARLAQTMPDVSLTLVGDGPKRQADEQLAQELGIAGRCRFIGARPREDALAYMASAAVVVVPSREEAYGLVNVEALAVGTPVVASRVGGISEVVRDGVDGLLVPADDPNALAEALELLLTNPALREVMGQNGRQHFLSQFELQTNVPRLAQWVEQPGGRPDGLAQEIDVHGTTIDEDKAVQGGGTR
jgi:glycosyltransferase involved in cell wall biosynthesis